MHRLARPSLLLALGMLALPARADVFCVQTAGELTAYLFAAGINLEDDEIRIRKGTYAMANGVYYDYDANPSENFDLDVSGGWYTRGTAPCGAQSDNPWETVLDGEGKETVLRLSVGPSDQQSSISVRLLTFMNGFHEYVVGASTIGGLEVDLWNSIGEEPPTGTLTIERNGFLLNQGEFMLGVDGGFQRITNNLMLLNQGFEGRDAAVAYLSPDSVFGSTFTNNTVIGNDDRGLLIYGAAKSSTTTSATTAASTWNRAAPATTCSSTTTTSSRSTWPAAPCSRATSTSNPSTRAGCSTTRRCAARRWSMPDVDRKACGT